MESRPNVVLIENSPADVTTAIRVLKSLNVQPAVVLTRVSQAVLYFEDVVAGGTKCPDLIVLDLDFGGESGFEILRLRKSSRALQQCEVLVWTIMGETEQELCRLFGLSHIISKHDGEAALKSALESCLKNDAVNTGELPDHFAPPSQSPSESENA
jgi:CheY-like chemotaxis protein